MQDHIFNLALAGILLLLCAIKQVIDIASAIEFLQAHSPFLVRVSKSRQWQSLLLLTALALLLHALLTSHSQPNGVANAPAANSPVHNNEPAGLKAKGLDSAAGKTKQAALSTRALRRLATEIIAFQEEMQRTSPPLVLSSISEEVTNRSLQMCNEHKHQTVIRFLATFSARLTDVIRDTKENGPDASPLETHLAALNSIAMMRLIAADVSSLANQAEAVRS
jgi:hypothetical protein